MKSFGEVSVKTRAIDEVIVKDYKLEKEHVKKKLRLIKFDNYNEINLLIKNLLANLRFTC